MAKERRLTTSEWIAERENDPVFLAKRKELEQIRLRNQAEFARHAARLLIALTEAGLPMESLSDLGLKSVDYRPQLHILLDWIPRISNPDVKEEAIRSLARKEAKPKAAPVLIREFWAEPTPIGEFSGMR